MTASSPCTQRMVDAIMARLRAERTEKQSEA